MDDEAALKVLLRALSWPGNTQATVARIHLYRGIAFSSLLHHDGARRSFTKALSIDIRIQLPRSVSPKISASFERLRRRLLRRQQAQRPLPATRALDDDALFPTPHRRRRPESDVKKGGGVNWPAWISASVATGLFAAGVGVGVAVQSAKSDAKSAALGYAEANAILDGARGQALAANVLFGAAAVAAGAAIYFFVTKRRPGDRRRAGVGALPGGAMLTVSGVVW